MTKKPVIGITLDFVNDSAKYKYSIFPWYALRQNYADCIVKAGGIPIMLPYNYEAIDDMLDFIDGLMIPGSDEDIHPRFYGQQLTASRVTTQGQRAAFEIAITKKALDRNLPFLGICNGMQILNVACGGDLMQEITERVTSSNIIHEQPHPKNIPSHAINIKPGTILASLASNSLEAQVNSTHHQAVDRIGAGLIVSANAPDGVVEAIESTMHNFVLGVEWHPEYLNSDLDLNVFKKLVFPLSI